MEKFNCKLCFKQFANGKALGGHMRSHLVALPLPPKTPPQKQDSVDGSGGRSESTLSLCSSEDKGVNYGLREKHKKSFRLVDPEFLDRESETESTRKQTRRRSKRARRMFFTETEDEDDDEEEGGEKKGKVKVTENSFSGDEEVARCLMMLSQDVWRGIIQEKLLLQCDICNRQFKSSQALGSHRTIHFKGGFDQKPRNLGVKLEDQKLHECPFCKKVFGSGQALGGHKRSHLFPSPTTKTSGSGSGSGSCSSRPMIDLNLPAEMMDGDDEEEPEVCAVSVLQG